jgi:hypothetical protein
MANDGKSQDLKGAGKKKMPDLFSRQMQNSSLSL